MFIAAVSSQRISSGKPAASGPVTPGTSHTSAPENGTCTTALARSDMPAEQGRYSASTQPCRLPIIPHSRTFFSPSASHGPISARKNSSKFPLPTRRIPCGEERLAKTAPSALSRNARKLLVPQSTAIKAYAPGGISFLTGWNHFGRCDATYRNECVRYPSHPWRLSLLGSTEPVPEEPT